MATATIILKGGNDMIYAKQGRVNIGNVITVSLTILILAGIISYYTGLHKTLPAVMSNYYKNTIQQRFNRPPEVETRRILNITKDLRFKIEAGMNYAQFSENVTKIYTEYKFFAEKYPNSNLTKSAGEIIDCYVDAKGVWNEGLFNNNNSMIGSFREKSLREKYPKLAATWHKSLYGWYYEEVLSGLLSYAASREKEFQKMIDEIY